MRLLKKWAAVLLSVCLILSSSGIRVQAEESAENGKNVMQGLAGSTGEENAETGQTVQDLENSRMEGKAKTEEEQNPEYCCRPWRGRQTCRERAALLSEQHRRELYERGCRNCGQHRKIYHGLYR